MRPTSASLSGMDLSPTDTSSGRRRRGDLDAVAAVLIADDLDDAGEIVLDADFLLTGWNRSDFDLATDAWVIVDRRRFDRRVRTDHAPGAERRRIVGDRASRRNEGEASVRRCWTGSKNARTTCWPVFRILDSATRSTPGTEPPHRCSDFEGFIRSVTSGTWGSTSRERSTRVAFPTRSRSAGSSRRRISPRCTPCSPRLSLRTGATTPIRSIVGQRTTRAAPTTTRRSGSSRGTDGQTVGALTANVSGDHGWVGEIGVLATHRGRGIAGALLRRSFATFAARGVGRVMLAVDAENPTGATALYERVGMRIIKRWDLWERRYVEPRFVGDHSRPISTTNLDAGAARSRR